jgi:putative spermidine/putrescine transport system ATP-binding protein
LSLRPERVTIRPQAGSVDNVYDAKVKELIYLGDHMRTRVTLLGHDDFVIKVPNSAGHQHLKVGESVPVGWHAEDCRALDHA